MQGMAIWCSRGGGATLQQVRSIRLAVCIVSTFQEGFKAAGAQFALDLVDQQRLHCQRRQPCADTSTMPLKLVGLAGQLAASDN